MKSKKFNRFVSNNKIKLIGILIGVFVFFMSFLINNPDITRFIQGIGAIIAGIPLFISIILESNREQQKEEMFLEFIRNLVESVRSGTPISKSILNIKGKDYGVLNPYIDKLASQISIGIPFKRALETFSRDTKSSMIAKTVSIISESEKSGGEIDKILDSVSVSVAQMSKLKKERKSSIYNLVVQGYIIFFIFIIIMLVMQFNVLPIASELGGVDGTSSNADIPGLQGMSMGKGMDAEQLAKPFFYLLLTQGFFIGLVIGKLSEGKIKYGLKHSFILVVLSILIYNGANLILK